MARWNNAARVVAAPGFIEPCLPTDASKPPIGPLWIHEIKHDGYRLLVRKDGERVRIYTRRGADWTHRFPLIVRAAAKLKTSSFYIDGEGVVCREDGLAVFDRLHSKANDDAVFLYAFDLLELDGKDLRGLPLGLSIRPREKLAQDQKPESACNAKDRGRNVLIFTVFAWRFLPFPLNLPRSIRFRLSRPALPL